MPNPLVTRTASALLALSATVSAGCAATEPDRGDPRSTSPATPHSTTPSPKVTTTVGPAPTSTRVPTATPTVDPYAGQPLIDHIAWTTNIDGARLLVYPTAAGRHTDFPGSDLRAWREIRTADPGADTAGMWDQFRCHWEWARLIARDKPSWNLEPWRPAVGYAATVDAACNPGGPER